MKCKFLIFLLEWLITSVRSWEIEDKFNYENNEEFYHNYDNFDNYTDEDELTRRRLPNFIERPFINNDGGDDPQDDITWRIKSATTTTAFYDYDQLKHEYDYDIGKLNASKAKLNVTEFKTPPTPSCEAKKIYNFGPATALCLISEYISSNSTEVQQKSVEYLKSISIIWLVIFSICFCCGWAHYGCLNFLCPFAMCFPEDGYERIKQYLVLNPPGIKIEKIDRKKNLKETTNFERVVYKASESEYFLYNNLWNDIYHV